MIVFIKDISFSECSAKIISISVRHVENFEVQGIYINALIFYIYFVDLVTAVHQSVKGGIHSLMTMRIFHRICMSYDTIQTLKKLTNYKFLRHTCIYILCTCMREMIINIQLRQNFKENLYITCIGTV